MMSTGQCSSNCTN